MLSYSLVWPSLVIFKVASFIQVLPINVDVATGRITPKVNTSILRVVYKFYYICALIKIIHLLFLLFHRLATFDENAFAVTVIISLVLSTSCTGTFWTREVFCNFPNEVTVLFNMLNLRPQRNGTNHDENDGSHESTSKRRRLVRMKKFMQVQMVHIGHFLHLFGASMLQLTAQELLVVMSPFAVNVLIPLYAMQVVLFPTWEVFLPAMLPFSHQGGSIYVMIGAIIEVTAINFVASTIFFVFFFDLSLQSVILPQLMKMSAESRVLAMAPYTPSVHRRLEVIQRQYQIFRVIGSLANACISRVLFTGKIMALSCSTLGSFFACRYFTFDPASIAVTVLAFDAIIFYVLTVNQLPLFTISMGNFRRHSRWVSAEILSTSTHNVANIPKYNLLKRRIAAMPNVVGIMECNFRFVSSLSTIAFLDFYINQVIDLVLAFE